jgi:hypothetical protein
VGDTAPHLNWSGLEDRYKDVRLFESTNTLIKRIMLLPIIQKQIAFKNVEENLKKYYHRL